MALARCRKCGKIASTAAKSCPHCGAGHPTRKPLSPFVKLLAAFAGTALVLGVVESSGLRATLSQANFQLPRIPISAPAPVADDSPVKKREKHRFQVTATVASTLKQSMEYPQSLVWETILSDDDASVICFEYRVKDSQGDYSREYMTFSEGKASEAPEDWNKNCAGKQLIDMIRVKDAV